MATELNAEGRAIKRRDIKTICEVRLHFTPSPGQVDIIRRILYRTTKRLAICCTTRYGKSKAVAAAVTLWLGWNKGKRCAVVAPTSRQTAIIRQYVLDFISADVLCTAKMVDWSEQTTSDKFRKELNRERYVLTNGASISFYSAEGEGKRLMGWGADLIIEDEAGLIEDEVYRAKISRMAGDSPDSVIVEIGNPWSMDSHFFKHWTSSVWEKIHIGWTQAVEEGRVSPEFIAEQKTELTPLEFGILYESEFPSESEDSVYSFQKILAATERKLEPERVDVIVGCDVADKGIDETVIYKVVTDGKVFSVVNLYAESKSEQTAIAGKIASLADENPRATLVNIDCIGIGAGVLSMVKERYENTKTRVQGCHYGTSALDSSRFANAKAEQMFFLKSLFDDGRIAIPKNDKLIRDLLGIKWTFTSGSKIKIVDPAKSPDYADALVYATWYRQAPVFGLG